MAGTSGVTIISNGIGDIPLDNPTDVVWSINRYVPNSSLVYSSDPKLENPQLPYKAIEPIISEYPKSNNSGHHLLAYAATKFDIIYISNYTFSKKLGIDHPIIKWKREHIRLVTYILQQGKTIYEYNSSNCNWGPPNLS